MIIALQLILSLSILIVLHEAGHFIPARLFKIRVEKFYLFFDWKFSLFKKKVGDTEYGIGWLPLGGYVKIAGMIDESMDTEQMKQEPQPWEFRSKPAWQRLIVMIGGVTVNVIVAFVIYAWVFASTGDDVLPVDRVTNGVYCDSLMLGYGFQHGDRIMALNGETPLDYNDINKSILLGDIREVTVLREGQFVQIPLPEDVPTRIIERGLKGGPFALRLPYVIDSVMPQSLALTAGLMKGDVLLGLDSANTMYKPEVMSALAAKFKTQESFTLYFQRGEEVLFREIKPAGETMLGVGARSDMEMLDFQHIEYHGVIEPLLAGYRRCVSEIGDYALQMKFIFTSSAAAKQVGGFVSFAKIFPDQWNWRVFWLRTAFISLILAFMNILPIPALDGGHVIFLLWEMITGKPVRQRVLEVAQMIGFFLLLALLIYANGMDIVRLFTQ
ncbi:MAG: RIP metalloprotease RseP [Flavobacteriales bacterium]